MKPITPCTADNNWYSRQQLKIPWKLVHEIAAKIQFLKTKKGKTICK